MNGEVAKITAKELVEAYRARAGGVVEVAPSSGGAYVVLAPGPETVKGELTQKMVRKFLWERRGDRNLRRSGGVVWAVKDDGVTLLGTGTVVSERVAVRLSLRRSGWSLVPVKESE